MGIEFYIGELTKIATAAVAAYVAAKVGVSKIEKILKTQPGIYKDDADGASNLILSASKEIIIVAAGANELIRKCKNDLVRKLDKGVRVRFLILSKSRYKELDGYICGTDPECRTRINTLCEIMNLRDKYPNLVRIREFDDFMTVSYIGIDLNLEYNRCEVSSDAIIQQMPYIYGIATKKCPINHFTYNKDKEQFLSSRAAILYMWADGKDV